MSRCAIFQLVTVVAIAAPVAALAGAPAHSLGRHYGHGWSDGYHSRAACPPKRHPTHITAPAAAPAAAPLPWWMIPADEAEPLPHPAGKQPATSRHSPSSGPSLFRQPGQGPAASSTLMR